MSNRWKLWQERYNYDSKGKVTGTYLTNIDIVDTKQEATKWINKDSEFRSATEIITE